MDKESGKSLQIDGKEVTSELTFTPEDAEGTVEFLSHWMPLLSQAKR